LNEHKSRFTAITIQGKNGYSTKLNTKDSVTLNVIFPEKFPLEPPLVYVAPKIDHEIVDMNGSVKDDSVLIWNINSSLKSAISTILNKLESPKTQVNIIQGNQRLSTNNFTDEVSSEILKDLQSKSVEELIYINFNQEEYVNDYTKKYSVSMNDLLRETNVLAEKTEKLKGQYDMVKGKFSGLNQQYEERLNALKTPNTQKANLDNKFTIEKLQEELKKNIEDTYQKPKQKLINDFLSKKVDFETFTASFKDICSKYHFYTMVNEKLSNLNKNN